MTFCPVPPAHAGASLSIAHGFGGDADRDHLVRETGSNVNRPINHAAEYDSYTGLPVMTRFAVPNLLPTKWMTQP
jgi:hypothetical protein